jgi:hypothetical protein
MTNPELVLCEFVGVVQSLRLGLVVPSQGLGIPAST